jgi:hypothetical protein
MRAALEVKNERSNAACLNPTNAGLIDYGRIPPRPWGKKGELLTNKAKLERRARAAARRDGKILRKCGNDRFLIVCPLNVVTPSEGTFTLRGSVCEDRDYPERPEGPPCPHVLPMRAWGQPVSNSSRQRAQM